ncbi:MAG: CHAT domain-containing protein [Proteobacteria bacterium]|nr:CHAT domain-containing protein [Pseudomonadota bacterium]
MALRHHLLAGLALAAGLTGLPARAAEPQPGLAASIAREAQTPQGRDKAAQLVRYRALKEAADKDPRLDPVSRATAERLYAVGLAEVNRDEEAMAAFDRGIALLTAAHQAETSAMAELLEGKAQQLVEAGEFDPARVMAGKALEIERAIYGEGSNQLFTVQQLLGTIEQARGRLDEAQKWYRAALASPEVRPTDQYNHVVATVRGAVIQSRAGDDDEAVRLGYQALAEAGRWLPDGDRGWGVIYTNLTSWLTNLGRYDAAEAVGGQALQYNLAHFGPDNLDTGAALRTMGSLKWRQGDFEAAEQFYRRALPALRDPRLAPKYPYLEGDAFRGLARLAISRQDYAGAERAALDGLASVARNNDKTNFFAYLDSTLARARFLRGAYAEALEAIEPAVVQLRKMLPAQAEQRVDAELLRARILSALDRKAEAWEVGSEQGRAMEARLADPRLGQRSLLATVQDSRVNLMAFTVLAVEAGQDEAAFRAAQLAAFSEIGVASRAIAARAAGSVAGGEAAMRAVEERQRELEQIDRQRAFAVGRAPDEVRRLAARRDVVERELDAGLEHLRQVFPGYDALTRPAPLASAALAASLRADQAMILPIQSDDRMVVLVLRRNGLSSASVPLDGNAMAGAVARLRHAMDGDATGFDPADGWLLGRALFNPVVLRALKGAREVAVLGSGPLMTLPLGMLLTAPPVKGRLADQPFAIKRFAFLVRSNPGDASGPRGGAEGQAFLGVGAPQLGPAAAALRGARKVSATASLMRGGAADLAALRALPSLPATEHELTDMASAIPAAGNRVLTGADATEAAVRAEPLERFGVIAFATHGLVSGELRGLAEPALVLTPPPGNAESPSNDGLLTASEAAGLKLNARWVILSACNTGAGADNGAGGYSGLARGFMQAGAQSLLVSLWPLRDDAAARLTVDTVRLHARGASQAEALRQAQLRLMADPRVADAGNPAVWAPFSLVTR